VGGPAVHAEPGLARCGRLAGRRPSALVAAKDTVNWLTGVQDEFSEEAKAKAAPLGGLAAAGETIGIGIFVVGVLEAL
jgi:hypothetical protein